LRSIGRERASGAQPDDWRNRSETSSGDAAEPRRHPPAARQAGDVYACAVDTAGCDKPVGQARQISHIVACALWRQGTRHSRDTRDIPDKAMSCCDTAVRRYDDKAMPICRVGKMAIA
jgi:hypothetical protein